MPDPSLKRIGFAGTPKFAQTILEGLLAKGLRPVFVLTAPDRPRGRGRKCLPTPVRELATSQNLPVFTPVSLRHPETIHRLAMHELDLLIVVAYGLILPKVILEQPRFGCLNVHPSSLPRWRGAAPIERAIMAGDTETGVCIMQMDEGLDTGPIFSAANLKIHEGTTGDELRQALAELGVTRLLAVLSALPHLNPSAQASAGAAYAEKITRADQKINWQRDAHMVARQIHALNSAAPAFSHINTGAATVNVRFLRVQSCSNSKEQTPGRVLESPDGCIHIACGSGCVSVVEATVLQGAGRRLSARQLLNGFPNLFKPGNRYL